jgi:glutamate dehydrogenase
MSEQLNAVCAQLLTSDDLTLDDALFSAIISEKIITKIETHHTQPSIKIYSLKPIYLSKIAPILHNFGFEIIDEVMFNLENKNMTIHINRFNLNLENQEQIKKSQANIERVISHTLRNPVAISSKLFYLVYKENLSERQLVLLSAIIEYIDQAVITINHTSILNTITAHHDISHLFIHYFYAKFNPKVSKRENSLKDLDRLITEAIKNVPNIIDDKILKLTYALLDSMVRTNYFLELDTVSFKIDTQRYSVNLKGVQPNLEIFVHHPEFSGLHLRMTKVSRGGLRWSERYDDYRQEVKSLMTTQEGKNSIIIPDGAKGGFVIRKQKSEITQEYFTSIYSKFINSLLDLVDNRVEGKIEKNCDIIAYDDEDPYFVVAADKGTAAMSDVANSIAIERNFWLGDAFASGGSNGYGHKDLGITARGAIASSKRFFIEKGVDIYNDEVSVIGIGSMKGDVFGNGLIETQYFKLLGAISHKEIFIDPTPNIESAYKERKRLFGAKDGSWSAYDSTLISQGGGVFMRSDKEIQISSEIRKMLNINTKILSGEELAKKLLTMKVDMLFNGGVGTYVKSSEESNLDLGDKQNEAVRIDAIDLKAAVVCEGGNLGFTHKARIDYALNGGKINVDGIDNAAGVNTSDHEVNLKILLQNLKEKGLISQDDANTMLQNLTDQVVNMVLWNAYRQSLALSRDEQLSANELDEFVVTIELLEEHIDIFNRRDFIIPKNENIQEIVTKKGQLVRPVLSALLSYSKIFIKELLIKTSLIDEIFALEYLFKYFPKSFVGAYEHEIKGHPLRREIIATMMADSLINTQGSTFISDFANYGEERFLLKIKSYLISNSLFGANDIRHEIFRQDYNLTAKEQYHYLREIEKTLTFSTRWMVKYLDDTQIDATHILSVKEQLFILLAKIHDQEPKELLEGNEKFNRFFNVIKYLRFAIPTIMIKEQTHHTFENVAIIFFLIISEFRIIELMNSLDEIQIYSENDVVLRKQSLQFIEFIIVHYTQNILSFQRTDELPLEAFKNYLSNDKETFETIQEQITLFTDSENRDIKEIMITINQLMASAI